VLYADLLADRQVDVETEDFYNGLMLGWQRVPIQQN